MQGAPREERDQAQDDEGHQRWVHDSWTVAQFGELVLRSLAVCRQWRIRAYSAGADSSVSGAHARQSEEIALNRTRPTARRASPTDASSTRTRATTSLR